MANTMPKISIAFRAQAETLAVRSARGSVAVILCDAIAASEEKHYELRSAADIPSGLAAANKTYLQQAFAGCSDGRVTRVLVYVLAATASDFTTAYAWLATQTFDWLVLPPTATNTQAAACKTWIDAQRSENSAVFKAVLPNSAADDSAIVNFITAGIEVGSTTYNAAQYCARIAGILAATPVTRSVTYTPLPEVENVERLTPTAMDTAVGAGKLLAFWDGQQVRLGTGVNSMTTVAAGQTEDMKKILIMECRDLMQDDLRRLCSAYIGQIKNTFDGRLTVLTAVRTYLETLETMTVVSSGWNAVLDVDATRDYLTAAGIDVSEMSDEEVVAYDYGTSMFIRIDAKLLDAIENITITVNC